MHVVEETLVGNVSGGGRLREVHSRQALAAVVPRTADRRPGTDAGNVGREPETLGQVGETDVDRVVKNARMTDREVVTGYAGEAPPV